MTNPMNIRDTKKKVVEVSPDPVEAYKQGWKDGRADLVKKNLRKMTNLSDTWKRREKLFNEKFPNILVSSLEGGFEATEYMEEHNRTTIIEILSTLIEREGKMKKSEAFLADVDGHKISRTSEANKIYNQAKQDTIDYLRGELTLLKNER